MDEESEGDFQRLQSQPAQARAPGMIMAGTSAHPQAGTLVTHRAGQDDREENTIFNEPTCTETRERSLPCKVPVGKELGPLQKSSYKNKRLQSTSG